MLSQVLFAFFMVTSYVYVSNSGDFINLDPKEKPVLRNRVSS